MRRGLFGARGARAARPGAARVLGRRTRVAHTGCMAEVRCGAAADHRQSLASR